MLFFAIYLYVTGAVMIIGAAKKIGENDRDAVLMGVGYPLWAAMASVARLTGKK